MATQLLKQVEVRDNILAENIPVRRRETFEKVKDKSFMDNVKLHDANFAFFTSELQKLHQKPYEPLYWVTYSEDVPIDVGGGFVDYVTYRTFDWAGIANGFRNVVGNNANYVPRINAIANQKNVQVFTFEVAYDLRFIDLEKAKKTELGKSIQEIYQNGILASWDFFVQSIAYLGANGGSGLFNSPNVKKYAIDNSSTTGAGFEGLTDEAIVSFFNGIFATYLQESGVNINILPDTILVPTFVGKELSSRISSLYTKSLRNYLIENNLGVDESNINSRLTIKSRPDLDNLGSAEAGRIVAYKKDKSFVRIDIPYPIQHYITLADPSQLSYLTAFVGQVSEIQLPYNNSDREFGVVSYWDFTTKKS